MDNFLSLVKLGNLDTEDKKVLSSNLRKSVIDLSGLENEEIVRLYHAVFGQSAEPISEQNFKICDGNKISKSIEILSDKERQVIIDKHGLETGVPTHFRNLGSKYSTTYQAVETLHKSAVKKLRRNGRVNEPEIYQINDTLVADDLTDEEKEQINTIKDRIFNSNYIFLPDKEYMNEPSDITPQDLQDMYLVLQNITEERLARIGGYKPTSIDELGFSNRTYNALKRAGITTIDALNRMDREQLSDIRTIGAVIMQEISEKLTNFNQKNKCEAATKKTDVEPTRKKPESDLEGLKVLKCELLEELETLQEQTHLAESLLSDYEKLTGSHEHSGKTQDYKDE